jgi:hypothetical protein
VICTVWFVLASRITARRIEQQWFNGHLPNRDESPAKISSGNILLTVSALSNPNSRNTKRTFRLERRIHHGCALHDG